MFSVMNDTKWKELQRTMLALDPAPGFRVLSTNGHLSAMDHEWFYHFSDGGFEDIQHVDVFPASTEQAREALAVLKEINVPGETTKDGFRIFGYIPDGAPVSNF